MNKPWIRKYSAFLKLDDQDRTRAWIAVVVLCVALFFSYFEILKRFELVTYDSRFHIKQPAAVDPQIVVIEISDDSVAKIGRWPWDRDWHASLTTILKALGAKAIVFDVLFSERSHEEKDALFAKSIQESGNVYLAEVVDQAQEEKSSPKILGSLPELSRAAKGLGHINLQPDLDGVMRRIPLFIHADGREIPQLALSVALDEWGASPSQIKIKNHQLIIPAPNGTRVVPLDIHDNFIIHWLGPWKDIFSHYSYAEVVGSFALSQKGQKAPLALDELKGKICFVGTTAAGLFDIRPTPLEPAYPAVGVNLTVLNNLLKQQFIIKTSFLQNSFHLVLLSFLTFFFTRSRSYIKNAILTVLLMFAYAGAAIGSFVYFSWWLPMMEPLILVLLIYFVVTLYNQLSVTIERAKLLKLATRDSLTGLYNIGHFKMLMKAELTTLSLRRDRTLSILMSDVDNFKKTNDTYGHLSGDSVLRELAAIIKNTCRALDVAARYGGEEFIVMLPGANAEEAAKVAEKIRKGLAAKLFFHEKSDFSSTISIGVTQVSPDETDINAIISRADKALYEAKHTGKDKVVIASDSPPTPPKS